MVPVLASTKAVQAQEAASADQDVEEGLSDEYSQEMQQRMGGVLTYRHEDGMNYNGILDDLIVGSCPQNATDVDRLADAGVGTIFCLQEDSDMAYFDLDIKPIIERCKQRGDIKHVRFPVRDFDPFSLRQRLPEAVATLVKEAASGRGKLYIHCTAGMGRAPGTALAYMYWYKGFQLMEAHKHLTGLRACNPKLTAIRAAICDILFDGKGTATVRIAVPRSKTGTAQRVQVAGLDVGWGQRLDLQLNAKSQRFELERDLPVGKFAYKFIFDEVWTYSADHPTLLDGGNINNYVEVMGNMSNPKINAARERLLSEQGLLEQEERETIINWLETCDSA